MFRQLCILCQLHNLFAPILMNIGQNSNSRKFEHRGTLSLVNYTKRQQTQTLTGKERAVAKYILILYIFTVTWVTRSTNSRARAHAISVRQAVYAAVSSAPLSPSHPSRHLRLEWQRLRTMKQRALPPSLKISQKNLGRGHLIMRIISPALYRIGVINTTCKVSTTRYVFEGIIWCRSLSTSGVTITGYESAIK